MTVGSSQANESLIEWTNIKLRVDEQSSIDVSNPSFIIPTGINVFHNFIDDDESKNILKDVDKDLFCWEGFEQRRHVLRFKDMNQLPANIERILNRFVETTGHTPKEISLEEYPKSQLQKHFNTAQTTVTRFESSLKIKSEGECPYFVAVLPVYNCVIESVNRPKTRQPDCWELLSKDHMSGIILEKKSLYVKTKEFLWDWRSRISASYSDIDENDPILFIKFSCLPEASLAAEGVENSILGYTPTSSDDNISHTTEMPPLEEMLTIIVTTSPIRSNPSTELLERVFDTFFHGGKDFAYRCRKVIVCDGCRQRDETVTRKHNNAKQAMRNGIVDAEQFENYKEFKNNLKKLCESAGEDSPFVNTCIEELDSRNGYGFALRHALYECANTPYVIVVQHDRTFMRSTPIEETVRAMWRQKRIKYVGMSMRSNLMYLSHFAGKYGKAYLEMMKTCILRPEELVLDSDIYGPNSKDESNNFDYGGQAKLKANIQALAETYRGSPSYTDHLQWKKTKILPSGKSQLSLVPTFFWYDNVHIVETIHYRDFIFHPPYKMVVRGGFVEDKTSPMIRKAVERLGLVHGHARFGCYLLDDHSGKFFTGHLDGGSYLTHVEKVNLSRRER